MTALGPGSISVGLYRRTDAAPDAALTAVCDEAKLVEACGFDGVTLSEHHMGFREYFPDPLLISGFILEETRSIWAGPMPMLLTLRPPAIVSEDIAWLAVRHGGRVAVGFAAGNRPEEHALYDGPAHEITARFERGLGVVAGALGASGDAGANVLRGDPAVDALRGRVPLVSAGRSRAAVRRAATYGMGILHSPLTAPDGMRRLAEEYVGAGGNGRRVLIYSVCISRDGSVHDDVGAKAAWTAAGGIDQVVDRLVSIVRDSGADALNLRFVRRGDDPSATRDQIAMLGDGTHLATLRVALRASTVVGTPQSGRAATAAGR